MQPQPNSDVGAVADMMYMDLAQAGVIGQKVGVPTMMMRAREMLELLESTSQAAQVLSAMEAKGYLTRRKLEYTVLSVTQES